MIEAVLRIASENYYSCEITRTIPVRVSLIAINGPEGFGIIESLDGTETPLKKYTKSMKQSKSILEFEVTHRSETQYWTRARHFMKDKSILETVLESGCMTKLPIIISNGKQTHTILSPTQMEFSRMFNNLRSRFTSVELERLRRYPSSITNPLLTKKQEQAFRIAWMKGYYEIPRKSEIEPLAFKIGIKRVAFQERLRRAERAIVREFALSLGMDVEE
ncbi:MAG: helix-turn-helix domain-containing protein [Candidatus Thorarchaeota archaeon]